MVRNILLRFQEYFSWIRMLSIVQLLPDEAYSRRPTAHFHSIDSERLRVALFLLSRLHSFWCTFPKEPDSRRTTLRATLLVDCGHALTDNCSHNGSEANSAPLNQPIVIHPLTVLLRRLDDVFASRRLFIYPKYDRHSLVPWSPESDVSRDRLFASNPKVKTDMPRRRYAETAWC